MQLHCYYNDLKINYNIKLDTSPPAKWQSKVREVLSDDNCSPEKLLYVLSQHPFLQECYSKYGQEGFSIAQHTQRVLELAQKYRTCLQKNVIEIASWNEFLLFLALHDIGKGIAKENESFAFGTKLSFKEGELEITQQIFSRIMKLLELPADKISLFCEMLRYDTQGLYLPGDIQLEEAFDNILEMANNCQQIPSAFYRLFSTFHLIDAASYPSLNQYFEFKLETISYCSFYKEMDEVLADSLAQAEKGKLFFEDCVNRVYENEDPNTLHHDFLLHLPELLKFLERMHKEMLAYPKQKETYQQIKKGFRDILVYFAKSSSDTENLRNLYAEAVQSSLGRRDLHQPSEYRLDHFFDNASEISELIDLKDKLMNFRKDYLCRYSLDKVAHFVQKEINAILSSTSNLESDHCIIEKVKEGIVIDTQALSLLPITYLHGTHSAILPILLNTGMQLMPFERLKQEHITPLREGSGAKGNNQYRISGTSLDHGMETYTYATQKNFPSVQLKEEEEIIGFLHFIQQCMENKKLLFVGKNPIDEWIRLSQAILRLRALDPELYETYQSKLSEAIQKIEADWKINSSTDMTKMNECIQCLKLAIDESLVIPQGVLGALRLPYGMIFASNTLHTMTSNFRDPSDRSAQKASLLGKDIQIIFTDKENKYRLKLFLKEKEIHEKVTLINLDILPKVIVLNQLASPYFADIASSKKLAEMIQGTPRLIRSIPSETTPPIMTSSSLSSYSYLGLSLVVVAVAVGIFRERTSLSKHFKF